MLQVRPIELEEVRSDAGAVMISSLMDQAVVAGAGSSSGETCAREA